MVTWSWVLDDSRLLREAWALSNTCTETLLDKPPVDEPIPTLIIGNIYRTLLSSRPFAKHLANGYLI